MRVISLGWGVQSFTLAAMAALGKIEPVDVALHSDTTWERQDTYSFAARWAPWLEARGVKVVTVRDQSSHNVTATISTGGKIFIPAYTLSVENNVEGQLRRQCTDRWKIQPMRRWLQANRNGQPVTMLLGISLDEWHRAKGSDVQYIEHEFPLLDLRMSRADCINWLQSNGLEVPPKSACVFCPYHNRRAWEEMKRRGGQDWEIAVQVDQAIRDKRPPYPLFVHNARKPLPEAVRIPEDEGAVQLDMFSVPDGQCDSGYCFL